LTGSEISGRVGRQTGWKDKIGVLRSASFVLLILVLCGPDLLSQALSNAGKLAQTRYPVTTQECAKAYPSWYVAAEGQGNDVARLRREQQLFEWALALNGANTAARWGLGRSALIQHNTSEAVEALAPLEPQAHLNSTLYVDLLTAYNQAGQFERVTSLHGYGQHPLKAHQLVSDTVALTYLGMATRQHEQEELKRLLERAVDLHPGDLYAIFHLRRLAISTGDTEAIAAFDESLAHFSLETVSPTNEWLLGYTVQVIPELLDGGIWDQDKALGVVSFLVWRHSKAPGVEWLLEQLVERYPTETDWLFYLGELYHRQRDLVRAEEIYRRVTVIDPRYAQAYLRLGMVTETQCRVPNVQCQDELRETASWYEFYLSLAPYDLFGLKKLTKTCTTIEKSGVENESCRRAALRILSPRQSGHHPGTSEMGLEIPPAAVLREELKAKTCDQCTVAELLGVEASIVSLGENVLTNGSFEDWTYQTPDGWKWSNQATGSRWNRGLFAGGRDLLAPMEGTVSMRADGLWLQYDESKFRGRSGWRSEDRIEINLEQNVDYVLSFSYKTVRLSDGALRVRLAPGQIERLPSTNGTWQHMVFLLREYAPDGLIYPLFNIYSPGQLLLDNVYVGAVNISTPQ
jgi:tetratricopeptide (TPR) repeat protein